MGWISNHLGKPKIIAAGWNGNDISKFRSVFLAEIPRIIHSVIRCTAPMINEGSLESNPCHHFFLTDLNDIPSAKQTAYLGNYHAESNYRSHRAVLHCLSLYGPSLVSETLDLQGQLQSKSALLYTPRPAHKVTVDAFEEEEFVDESGAKRQRSKTIEIDLPRINSGYEEQPCHLVYTRSPRVTFSEEEIFLSASVCPMQIWLQSTHDNSDLSY